MSQGDYPFWARRLGPRQLQTLLVIAQTGSLSGAAQRMATTQPGLSKWLKGLEEALGVVLFERTTRRLAPTDYGRIVLRLAEQVLGDTLRMHDEIRALQAGRLGRVKVGILPGLGAALMPGAVAWLEARQLQLEVALRENTLDALLPDLREHRLDMLVARLDRTALSAGVQVQPLFHETACVMAPVNHPLHRQAEVSWHELAVQPWILPSVGSPMRNMVESAFERAGLATPRSMLESASSLINRAVARRLGCLFVSTRFSATELERDGTVRRLPIVLTGLPTAIAVLWMVETLAPQHQHMVAALQAATRELGGTGALAGHEIVCLAEGDTLLHGG